MQEIPELYGDNGKANEHLGLPSIYPQVKIIEYTQNKLSPQENNTILDREKNLRTLQIKQGKLYQQWTPTWMINFNTK